MVVIFAISLFALRSDLRLASGITISSVSPSQVSSDSSSLPVLSIPGPKCSSSLSTPTGRCSISGCRVGLPSWVGPRGTDRMSAVEGTVVREGSNVDEGL